MKVLISFADEKFKSEQKFLTTTGLKKGKFDKVLEYSLVDVDDEFKNENKEIFNLKRGNGYWLWKPFLILKALSSMNYGDYLFYCDSACYFVQSIDVLIEEMEHHNCEIMPFSSSVSEIHYTKKELFEEFNLDEPSVVYSNQIIASFILMKKTDAVIHFMEEYLQLCKNPKLLTDEQSSQQDEAFIDHRHDQSIFSLLIKKYRLPFFKDPSQNGNFIFEYSKHAMIKKKNIFLNINLSLGTYQPILVHYRKRKLYNKIARFKYAFAMKFKVIIYHLLLK